MSYSKWEAMKTFTCPSRHFDQAAMLTSRHLCLTALAPSNQGAMLTSQPTLSTIPWSLGMVMMKCLIMRWSRRRRGSATPPSPPPISPAFPHPDVSELIIGGACRKPKQGAYRRQNKFTKVNFTKIVIGFCDM